ncbi:hypothetical protein [Nitratireductor basaltis]|uniref:Uncharacterized protein n=1 Tax=Nitratireductor basaltis TaxID=472175 RepID=A0A084U8E0_9HYPH|nr:hypothetical protein [Nitratireductor basaltis]KFB09226.1 hypothetical protein EL18_00241 [Nitratireductor basaltis]
MKRVVTLSSIAGAIAVALFVSVEVLAAAGAALWSISGLMHLGQMASTILAIVLGLPTLWAVAKICQLSWAAETDPENN